MFSAVIGLYLLMLSTFGPGTQAEATWVHNSLDGNIQRNGTIYHAGNPENIAVGVDSYGRPRIPLGTWLVVCRVTEDTSACAIGEVRDTGYLGGNLDLSPAMFERLGVLGEGRIRIEYWRLEGQLWVKTASLSKWSGVRVLPNCQMMNRSQVCNTMFSF